MEKIKKMATKPKPKPKNTGIEIISYAVKMVIPIGDYANIQPEIIVKANSIQEAHDFIAPHMNKLWKEYYLVNERRPDAPAVPVSNKTSDRSPSMSTSATQENVTVTQQNGTPPAPDANVALIKATQAIDSCLSMDALLLISNQINVSVKLTEEDKAVLTPLWEAKREELELNGQ